MKDTRQLLDFIGKATSPFHAVDAAREQLDGAGYEELVSHREWKLLKGGKYYVIHHGSSLVAFQIGKKYTKGDIFRVAAAHTDFPCLRIKPNPDMTEAGYARINVEMYGGAILNTWMDRPLSVAGRVALQSSDPFKPVIRLVDVRKSIFTIPNLAIHLNKDMNKGVELNKQTDMIPIAGMLEEKLNKKSGKEEEKSTYFIDFLAEELSVKPDEILDFELSVYCAEKGQMIGIKEEFISAPRLDNMTSVQAVVSALTESSIQQGIRVGVLFDHEEIGSKTKQGAGSLFLANILEKICAAMGSDHIQYIDKLSESMLLSVDVAHGYHPSHAKKYDPVNKAVLNSGVSIKEASGQSYATDCEAIAIIQQLCMKHKISYRKFVNRSDGSSGGTLGSIASTLLPMMTVDVGVPLLAMHSARELMGVKDQKSLKDLIKVFFGD